MNARLPRSPAVLRHLEERAASSQLVVADAITRFAGSMRFVYIHAIVFAIWCSTGLFGFDKYPFNFLTMTVSLEAIFLATFVMIGQNRQADFAAAKADHDFHEQETELKENTRLTGIISTQTKLIARLTGDLHTKIVVTPKVKP